MSPKSDSATPPPRLQRVLGLPQVTAGGVGIIIGAGIYVLVGAATQKAGAAVWMSFALAAGLSALTALSYMELTSMFPSSAGEFEYTRHAFPGWLAFLVGWVMVAGLIVASAAISLGFASYLTYFIDLDVRLGAVGLLMLVWVIAFTGIKESALLTMVLSAVQVGGLLFVIAIGIPHLGQVDLLDMTSAGGVLSGAALVFFAFIGFDEVITLAEETEDPTRTVPAGLALALGLSTVLYLGVAVASVSVLGADALGASKTPLADVIAHSLGGSSARIMAGLAVLSTTNTTLLAVTASSRLLYGISRQGLLPSPLASLDPTRHTPAVALLATVVLAGGFVMLKDLTLVASVTDFAVYVVFLAVNATVLILRFKRPGQPRRFRVPGSVGAVPVLPVIAFASVAVMMTQLDVNAVGLGVLLIAAGAVLPPLFRALWPSAATGSK